MQISIPWRRGWKKPFPSIPRINWAHPLAQKLICYVYDCGGGVVIDLVSGQIGTHSKVGTPSALAAVAPSPFGSGWKYAQQSSTSLADGISFPANIRTNSFTSTAPYSFAAGFMPVSPINASGSDTLIYVLADATAADNWWAVGDQGTGQPVVNFGADSDNAFTTGRAWVPGNFTTVVGVLTAATTGTGYYMDDSGYYQTTNWTGLAPNNDGTGNRIYLGYFGSAGAFGAACHFNGFIFYGATWRGRKLSTAEAKYLGNDPWCLLWYPEDEIFATLVGGGAPTPPGPGPNFRTSLLPMMGVG